MKKHQCKVKFGKNDEIICASEVLCGDCPEKIKCEEIDIYIKEIHEENIKSIAEERMGVNM